jgi:hypothetical protein
MARDDFLRKGNLGKRGFIGVITVGFISGVTGGITGWMTFSLSMFPAPGCLGRGLRSLPGSVGIVIPNHAIVPRFAGSNVKIIVLLMGIDNGELLIACASGTNWVHWQHGY